MSTKTMTTKTTAMGLADATFLIEKLGHECGEAQFLRELTQNAIEAIEATGRANGEIRWDYDEYLLEETGAYKLCITDNGCGMSGAQMERYLNNLSSSSRVQGLDANFGMGAKIAALPRNPEGLVYLSWQCGKGTLAHLWKDPHAGTYGLQQLSLPNDTFGSIGGVSDAQTPDLIGSTGTGTRVVLMGRSPEDNTTRPPAEFANKSEWIQKELNKRYFRFPAGIKVSARTHITQTNGAPGTGKVRRIDGMHAFLSDAASSSGTVPLADATAHWWIIPEKKDLARWKTDAYEAAGHVAALYKDELYSHATGRTGTAKLQQFGVVFGAHRVVIYVEPSAAPGLAPNTARTTLTFAGQELPWSEWAAQFREKMPEPLAALVDELGARISGDDHSKQIRDRLRPLMSLFQVKRFLPDAGASERVDPLCLVTAPSAGKQGAEKSSSSSKDTKPGGRAVRAGGVYGVYERPDGIPARPANPDVFPEVKWVSLANGGRSEGDLVDRAARYLEETNTLLINEDFRGFTALVDRTVADHGDNAGNRAVCHGIGKRWFEQQLVETVLGVQALRNSPEWGTGATRAALSEEALTAAVMARSHAYYAMKREVASRLGALPARLAS